MASSHLPHRCHLQPVSSPIQRQPTSLASSTTSIGSSKHPLFLQTTNRNLPLFIMNLLRLPNFLLYNLSASSNSSNMHPHEPLTPPASNLTPARNKPILSSPQKRLNHIMSEQKRRNAIREGYAQLTTLLAPKGAPPGTGMPTRGRPKGSGGRGKGRTKGKSGVLFRAVEYCHWLEEGIEALMDEVRRVEASAGIRAG
jgi:hypothetical protein